MNRPGYTEDFTLAVELMLASISSRLNTSRISLRLLNFILIPSLRNMNIKFEDNKCQIQIRNDF